MSQLEPSRAVRYVIKDYDKYFVLKAGNRDSMLLETDNYEWTDCKEAMTVKVSYEIAGE